MSGAWAREADAAYQRLLEIQGKNSLDAAVWYFGLALATTQVSTRRFYLASASGIIRGERKRLDAAGACSRRHDWQGEFSDENLIWGALRLLATVDSSYYVEHKVWHLRMAEAALRTLHKRGRS